MMEDNNPSKDLYTNNIPKLILATIVVQNYKHS